MYWTVITEDEKGNSIDLMELSLDSVHLIHNEKFKVLKYLDTHGDTTFNSLMFDDLVIDLQNFKTYLDDSSQVDQVITMAIACKKAVHTYLKFYGD